MLDTIRNFHQQFETSLNLLRKIDLGFLTAKKIRTIFFAGMGGSSLPADVVQNYLPLEEPLRIIRDYHLPPMVNSSDLVICSSYSGNTEETLSVFQEALKVKADVVVLTHGGKLAELAKQHGVPLIPIPSCIQPRCALGNFFTSTLWLLEKLRVIGSQEKELLALAEFLKKHTPDIEEASKKIALSLKGYVPVVTGPTILESVCRIWKIKFNENAKIQSFYNVFPELNHNEMVGYSHLLMKVAFVSVKTPLMNPRIARRMEVMENLLSSQIPFHNINLKAASLLEALFEAQTYGDFTSYYLAKEYGVDPAPVPMVEEFKKLL